MELLNFDLSRSLLHPKLIDQLSVFDIVYFFGASDRPMVKICEEIEYIRLPVVDEKADRKISIEKFPIVHPHRILSYLFDVVGIQLDDADIEHFWNHSRAMKEPWAIDHPASPQHVPLGLHGDGARLWTVYRVEKMVGVYMNIIHFRPLSVRHFHTTGKAAEKSYQECGVEKTGMVFQCCIRRGKSYNWSWWWPIDWSRSEAGRGAIN